MKESDRLLVNNKLWAAEMRQRYDDFFENLSKAQKPNFLWIGCSDSRVLVNQITNTKPGEVFIHRNIANLVVNTDLNLLSVLQYAVEDLEVQHIIVCGHYDCGGIKAAMNDQYHGNLSNWLLEIKDIHRLHKEEIDEITDHEAKINRMTELNVIEQIRNLAKTPIIQRAWQMYNYPYLHGWIYSFHDGILQPLIEIAPNDYTDEIYKLSFNP